MYVFGGFNSLLLSDILVFTSEQCEAHQSEAACLAAGPGVRCVWDTGSSQCVSWELAPEAQRLVLPGPVLVLGTGAHCNFLPLLDLKLTGAWLAW